MKKLLIIDDKTSISQVIKKQKLDKLLVFKHLCGIFFAGMTLLVASPVLLITIIAVNLESKGKVYYITKRVETAYRIFNFLKLCSMYIDAKRGLIKYEHLDQYQKGVREQERSSQYRAKNPLSSVQKEAGPVLFAEDIQVEEEKHIRKQLYNK